MTGAFVTGGYEPVKSIADGLAELRTEKVSPAS